MRSVIPAALLTLTLGLTPQASSAPISGPLTGQIRDWPAGKTGEVRLTLRAGARAAPTDTVIATAPVDAEGRFSLALPGPAALDAALPASSSTWPVSLPCSNAEGLCSGALNLATAARVALFDLQAYAEGERLNTVKFGNAEVVNYASGQERAELVYASARVKVTGELSTSYLGSARNTWDASLESGWNWMLAQVGGKDAASGLWPVSYTGGAAGADAHFHLTSVAGTMDMALVGGQRAGAAIHSVTAGGAAEVAGLRAGDEILEIDGVDVRAVVPSAVASMTVGAPGTPIVLKVLRGEETLTITVIRGSRKLTG